MTGDISEDESRVCRCTMVLCPGDKFFLRKEDALEKVSRNRQIVIVLRLHERVNKL